MEFKPPFFHEFAEAWSGQEGPRLARTLTPDLPTEKLRKICDSQNAHDIKNTLKRGLQGNAALVGGIDHQEVQGWVEVYAAYWHAARSILSARLSSSESSQVSGPRTHRCILSLATASVLRDSHFNVDFIYSRRS